MGMDKGIKVLLGYDADTDDEIVYTEWQKRINSVCKPCWELKYCPYGPLVEDFPLLPSLRSQAIKHNQYLQKCLESGVFGDEFPLDDVRRSYFETAVATFRAEDYPEEYPSFITDIECTLFGHLCPVFFVHVTFSETEERRKIGRYMPYVNKVQIVRRDGYTCQSCGTPLGDDKLEFNPLIPVSQGGSLDEQSVQLICFYCAKTKFDKGER